MHLTWSLGVFSLPMTAYMKLKHVQTPQIADQVRRAAVQGSKILTPGKSTKMLPSDFDDIIHHHFETCNLQCEVNIVELESHQSEAKPLNMQK